MAKTIKECKCDKCGYEWWPNKPGRPAACPGCKNIKWDKGPKKPGGRGRKKDVDNE
jgi:predicted Zn-ribbon and HTH transcriptional regulator